MMWWYILAFFGGCIVGMTLIALMAANKEYVVHVYMDEKEPVFFTADSNVRIVYHAGGGTNENRTT